MSNDPKVWYQFALQQMAAESILDRADIPLTDPRNIGILNIGNTDTRRTRPEDPLGYTRMPDFQAAQFIEKYAIVVHHANDSTGFSGTLLRWTNDQGDTEYTLSLRSTEFKPFDKGGDRERDMSGANGEIIGNGFAIGQLAALEDFYQREVLPIVGASKINVTGYSLGGHLATVFTETHSEAVKATYVFNGAGRGAFASGDTTAARMKDMIAYFRAALTSIPDGSLIEGISAKDPNRSRYEALYKSALAAYVADPMWDPFASSDATVYQNPRYRWAKVVTRELAGYRTAAAAPFRAGLGTAGDGLITSIYGNALKGDSTLVANSQIHASNKHAVYIEGQPLIEGLAFQEKRDFGNTHAITLIVDSLALMREFQRLDPNLSQAQIEVMIAASSAKRAKPTALLSDADAVESDSLERTLFALRRALDPEASEVQADGRPGGFGDIANRQSYYEELARLPQEGSYRIEVLAGKSASEIELLAKRSDATGLAVRYALRQLEPFAVVGGNYSSSRFPNGEVELYDAATGRGLSDKWIEARSRFLETLGRYNAADGDLAINDYFQDQERGIALGLGSPQLDRVRTVFASDSNEQALIGSSRDDFVSGGANGDVVTVNAGNDYVEGGGGRDAINGGPGSDQLHGGAANDELSGGPDADKLYGGAGFDTYVYEAGDGRDEIVDSDGSGQILYKGRILSGGTRTGRFEWIDGEDVRYELVGNAAGPRTLVIDGKLTVRNFAPGDLGIVLQGEEDPPARPEVEPVRTYTQLSEIFGTAVPYPADQPPQGTSIDEYLTHHFVDIYGSDANDTFTYVSHPFGFPGFYGRGGDDEVTLAGAVGNAAVSAGAGDDIIDASASTPLAGPFPAAMALIGGSGGDFILGGAAGETIFGDNYRVQERFQDTPGAPSPVSSSYLIDDFIVNLRSAYPNDLLNADPATLEVLANAGAYYYEAGPFGPRLPEYVVIYHGADALIRYLQLEGWLNLGDLSAAMDYVLGPNPTFDDFIDAGAGNDQIYAGSGSDEVLGGPGNDLIDGDKSPQVDQLGALASLFGEPGDDLLDGGEGNDILSDLLGGNDTVFGGAGDDTIVSDERVWALDLTKAAFNYLDGGDGNDRITATSTTPDDYDIVDGGAGNDVLQIVSEGGGTILGGDGNDTISAFSNAGWFDVDGGAGDDAYLVTNGVIRDESGDDTLTVPLGSAESRDALFDSVVRGLSALPAGSARHDEVSRSGNDLVVFRTQTSAGQSSASSLVIADWFAGDAPPIEHIVTLGGGPPPPILPPVGGVPPPALPPVGGVPPREFESWGSFAAGSDAAETFTGGAYRDRILAGGGDDLVSTGEGEDLIAGGPGNDVLDGGGANDSYFYALGDGNDVIADESGDDRLLFGQGIGAADVTVRSIGDSTVFLSVAGNTIELRGSSPVDLAIEKLRFADGREIALSGLLETAIAASGGAGNDVLSGNAIANVMSGGSGDDSLSGGAGDDTYLFNLGDGIDRISDTASAGEGNTVRFGPGISPDMLSLGLGSLEIHVGEGGDAIHLENVDPNDVLGAHDVELFEFDDGTRLTYSQLLERGFDLYGTDSDDLIAGSGIADRVHGRGGDDLLIDSAGDDAYFFGRGDGNDTLTGVGGLAEPGADSLVFESGISQGEVSVRGSGDDIVIEVANGGGSVTVQEALLHDVVETVRFADGRAWTAAMLREQAGSPTSAEPGTGSESSSTSPAGTQATSIRETPVFADIPSAPAPATPASPTRQNTAAFVPTETPPAPRLAPPVGVPADPLFRDMQQRFGVLLQTGRANLGERYADAIREFELRRQQREEAPSAPPPTEEEVAAWNTAMHAWHERNPGFAESELGGGDGAWTLGWGLPASGGLGMDGGASVGGVPGLANPHALPRLSGAGAAPGLGEGFRDPR